MAAPTITRFFSRSSNRSSESDNVVLAPESINNSRDPDALIQPDEFKLQGEQYTRCSVIARGPKSTKKRTSVIWLYGEDLQSKRDRKRVWYCYLCEKQRRQQELPAVSNGNSTALDHLHLKHHIDKTTGELKSFRGDSVDSSQPSISDYQDMKSIIFSRRLDRFKELLVRWLVCCHIAFFQIENGYFRDLLFYLFPPLADLLPKAASTIRQWVMNMFEVRKERLWQDMLDSRSSISLSFDLWTSPNYLAVLGVAAHFIDKSGLRRTAVLALREVEGEHSGENIADVLLQVIKDYKITDRVGYFMSDNASANDVCVDSVLRAVYPRMSDKQRKRRRLRCFGHIVNLCAQAFLIGKDAEKVCKDLDAAYREAQLIQSQQTRWNSYFTSIGRALNVKERIQVFCDQYEAGQSQKSLTEDRLSEQQWDELAHPHDQLETFYDGTLSTEGRLSTLADHFQTLDWLLNEIQQAKIKFEELHKAAVRRNTGRGAVAAEADDFAFLAASAEASWRKAEEYFKKADETPAYYAAIALNPTLKNQWYIETWTDEEKKSWIPSVTKLVRGLWLEEYRGRHSTEHASDSASFCPTLPAPVRKEKAFVAVKSHKRLKLRHEALATDPPAVDLLDQFLETDVIRLGEDETFDPISYWNDRYYTQPDLARMALDVLAVPSMSDECERLFSSAKILLSDRRSRLKIDIIEASECLRSWFGPPARNTFEDINIGRLEGESDLQGTRQDGEGSEIRMGNEDLQTVDQDGFLDEDNTTQEGLR
ncbi:HAT domain-containing protein [Ilyonectria robusta]